MIQIKLTKRKVFDFNSPFLFVVKLNLDIENEITALRKLHEKHAFILAKYNKDKIKRKETQKYIKEVSKCDSLSDRFKSH